MFRVIVSPRAWRDFFEIVDFIREDNPSAAECFGKILLDQLDVLASFPHIGTPVGPGGNVRKVLQTPVRIYYRTDERRKRIEIIHFWHAARRSPRDL